MLHRHNSAQDYRFLQRLVYRLSQHNLKFHTIVIFKAFVKENTALIKTCKHVRDLFTIQNFTCLRVTVHEWFS
jgi:hypothetical protein